MKTKIFNVWTPLVEDFLKQIATPQTPYEQLSDWMDNEGARLFQSAQGEYFIQHKATYLCDTASYPPPVNMKAAYYQIDQGFQKTYEGLSRAFPGINTIAEDKFNTLKQACLAEKFLPFIAARAMMAYLVLKTGSTDRLSNINQSLEAFELLASSAIASIESINEFKAKLPSGAIRDVSTLFVSKAATANSQDAAVSTAPTISAPTTTLRQ